MGGNKKIVCADGFSMSDQANAFAYCDPRVDDSQKNNAVEVGFPSEYEPLIAKYAEDDEDYTGTVYGWVPADVVTLVCVKHGGVVSGDLPPGIPYLRGDQ
mgnify:CR=1 FL=1